MPRHDPVGLYLLNETLPFGEGFFCINGGKWTIDDKAVIIDDKHEKIDDKLKKIDDKTSRIDDKLQFDVYLYHNFKVPVAQTIEF